MKKYSKIFIISFFVLVLFVELVIMYVSEKEMIKNTLIAMYITIFLGILILITYMIKKSKINNKIVAEINKSRSASIYDGICDTEEKRIYEKGAMTFNIGILTVLIVIMICLAINQETLKLVPYVVIVIIAYYFKQKSIRYAEFGKGLYHNKKESDYINFIKIILARINPFFEVIKSNEIVEEAKELYSTYQIEPIKYNNFYCFYKIKNEYNNVKIRGYDILSAFDITNASNRRGFAKVNEIPGFSGMVFELELEKLRNISIDITIEINENSKDYNNLEVGDFENIFSVKYADIEIYNSIFTVKIKRGILNFYNKYKVDLKIKIVNNNICIIFKGGEETKSLLKLGKVSKSKVCMYMEKIMFIYDFIEVVNEQI